MKVEGENGLVWDIYSQVGAWVRGHARSNPLRRVRKVYGFGYSQTGGYLYDYINAIHPRVVAEDGRPPFDGYIVAVASRRDDTPISRALLSRLALPAGVPFSIALLGLGMSAVARRRRDRGRSSSSR